MSDISQFFYPRSVCIAGASTKEKSIGFELLKTIISYGYTGKIFPVNPKAEEILGIKCFESISDIKEAIDLVIIVVPKQFVETTLDQIIQKKIKSVILITAGFKEIGTEGINLENKILQKVRENNIRLIGPNCMGIINSDPDIKLNATFVAEKPETGNMAFLSQSGALGAAVLNSLRDTDIRFAHFVSVGNKADLNENDFIKYWQTDKNINVITLYLESFENGFEFIKKYITGHSQKPTIILKAGKTDSGMKAASSHTGALSGEDRVVDSLLNQFGIIRADNLNEMFNTAKGFENFPMPVGNRIAVITNAGGPAILAVDKIEKENLILAELNESTKNKLREIVHPEGSVNNPVDLLPGGSADIYKQVAEIVLADSNVDSVISIFVEPVMVEPISVVESVNSIESDKPIFQVIMPLPEFWENYRTKSDYKKPLFRNPEDPAEVISNMLFFNERKTKLGIYRQEYLNLVDKKSSINIGVEGYLSPTEISRLTDIYNIPVCRDKVVSYDELKIFNDFSFPIVLKAIGKKFIHKSDLGAVKLNIGSLVELMAAADEMTENFKHTEITPDQFYVQEYVEGKHELLIGGYRDPSFGPIIMFGAGGKYVEVFQDTIVKSAFSSYNDIADMINKTKIGKILAGVRGDKPTDIKVLVKLILNCCRMMIENSNIKEFDINPLLVTNENLFKAVDIRIKIENTI